MSYSRKRPPTTDKPTDSFGASTSAVTQPSTSSITHADALLYHDNGDCTCVCEHCGALFWYDERINAMYAERAYYSHCCRHDRVKIQQPSLPPALLLHLVDEPDFITNIRAYNNMFAMTSFGAKVDDSINIGSGPYVFKVEGQIYRWIGSLCPSPGQQPRFLQMYVYDTDNEISNRLSVFPNHSDSRLNPDVVALLIQVLETCNSLVKLFRTARDLCRSSHVPTFCIRLFSAYNSSRYNCPTSGSIGAIVHDPGLDSDAFDIVIRHKVDGPQRINILHPLYMALQYPLLFVHGESGWSPDLRLLGNSTAKNNNLTRNMFYSYQLHDRSNVYALLLRAGRLFQQYLVDTYVCIEQDRLNYHRYNQNALRTEYMQGIHDAVEDGDTVGKDIGKRIILPSTFTGGPRYMYKHYQDALAICTYYGNPQYFITFTCNVRWPEICRHMTQFTNVKPQDRPDIIARVFHMKVISLVNYLRVRRPFGKVAADLYTIEFQKRGLPHCHLLLWVDEAYKIRRAEQLDSYISAEIPDQTIEPALYTIVTDCMMHGPCGTAKPTAPCMRTGSCKKHFPKDFQDVATFDENGYAHYKRRDTPHFVSKNGVSLHNDYVVPYNRALLLRYHAHINVEYCGWTMLIKYLFKYISKGTNRIRYAIQKPLTLTAESPSKPVVQVDEIKNFVDGRFICPHEAAWRIFDFFIHQRNPPVQVLSVHLENMQNVTFKDNEKLIDVLQNQSSRRTTLTEWLANNCTDSSGLHLRYVDYISEYRWEPTGKCLLRRIRNRTPTISRVTYIHPTAGDIFFLRMLLAHQKGCRSFADIRTVSGEVFPTYLLACEKLGLLEDDNEWFIAFEEAATWASATELRSLFIHMLLFCEVSNPRKLFDQQWKKMADDAAYTHRILNDEDQMQYVLFPLLIDPLLFAEGFALAAINQEYAISCD